LLAGLEYRQKVAHPTYYLDKIAEKEALRKTNAAQVCVPVLSASPFYSFFEPFHITPEPFYL